MTVRQLLDNMDARELSEWRALRTIENEERRTRDVIQRSQNALKRG